TFFIGWTSETTIQRWVLKASARSFTAVPRIPVKRPAYSKESDRATPTPSHGSESGKSPPRSSRLRLESSQLRSSLKIFRGPSTLKSVTIVNQCPPPHVPETSIHLGQSPDFIFRQMIRPGLRLQRDITSSFFGIADV